MKSVNELCRITGVTRKTLFYYDRIGLLKPAVRIGKQRSKAYEDNAVEILKEIRIYQEAGLHLSEIRTLLYDHSVSREEILRQVLERLYIEKDRLTEEIRRAEALLEQNSSQRT